MCRLEVVKCCSRALLRDWCYQDPYTLAKCGQVLAGEASTPSEMFEAVKRLHTHVQLEPDADTSFHSLGLAYRVLWLNDFIPSCSDGDDVKNRRPVKDNPKFFLSLDERKDNPLCDDCLRPGYSHLAKANAYFRKACDIKPGSCRYLVDLGRTYASLGQQYKGRDCLFEARRQILDKNTPEEDMEYLMEQLKLFRLTRYD